MKVRIIDAGFAKYTGQFGSVDFVDGVSDDISQAEAARLGSILRVEVEGTGKNPSATQLLVDSHNKNLEQMGIKRPVFVEPKVEAEQPKPGKQEKAVRQEAVHLDYSFTEDDLAALVRKEGIAGLRTFAEPFDVNGRSIAGMVRELMDLKHLHQPKAQPKPVEEVLFDEAIVVIQDDDMTEEEKIAALNEIEAAANAAIAEKE